MRIYRFFFIVLLLPLCKTTAADQINGFELPRTQVTSITDAATNRLYQLHIQLPRYYAEDKTYPVVYMTDSPYTFPIVTGAARFPINFRRMEDILFVGISWQSDHSGALSRQRDYTPTPSSPGFKDPSGEAARHLAFIRNDVFAYIEQNFKTDTDNRTYIGNSFGGLFGLYIFLTEPQTFKNYVIGSPSIWWDNKYLLSLEAKTQLNKTLSANMFISVGAEETTTMDSPKNEMVGDAREFYNRLKARNLENLNLELRIIESANHATAFPTTAIQGLWWLFNTNDKAREGVALTHNK